MPNGKPGDHPLTDIVVHKFDLIGGGVDQEIRALVSERPELKGDISRYLWDQNIGAANDKSSSKQRSEVRAYLATLTAPMEKPSGHPTQLPRETLGTVLFTWAIRVGIVGVILYAVQQWFGPFEFLWWAWPAYAAISLAASLALMRIKNGQTEKLEDLLDQTHQDPDEQA